MMFILRACVTVHKRFFYKDFSNLGRTLTYVACNNCIPKVREDKFYCYLSELYNNVIRYKINLYTVL